MANSLSAKEGMKGAELPVSDVFIKGYGEHEGTIKKSKAKIMNFIANFLPSYSKRPRHEQTFTILGNVNASKSALNVLMFKAKEL